MEDHVIVAGDTVIPEGVGFPVLVVGLDAASGYLICHWYDTQGARRVSYPHTRISTFPRETCKWVPDPPIFKWIEENRHRLLDKKKEEERR